MDLMLDGKRAIVLGGSRGIGWYVAEQLKQEGCAVALCARGEEGVADALRRLAGIGSDRKLFGRGVDLADGDAAAGFVRDAIDALGGCDVLIHNASAFGVNDSEEDWRRSFEVDVMAGVRATEAALPALRVSEAGSITFIGSMASKFHFGRPPSPYGPMKAAMRAYANELAQNFGQDGIRANVVSPGAVWFPGGTWDETRQTSPRFYASVERSIPLGRLGTGEEIARIVAFVASPAGMWLNSTHLAADGGQVSDSRMPAAPRPSSKERIQASGSPST